MVILRHGREVVHISDASFLPETAGSTTGRRYLQPDVHLPKGRQGRSRRSAPGSDEGARQGADAVGDSHDRSAVENVAQHRPRAAGTRPRRRAPRVGRVLSAALPPLRRLAQPHRSLANNARYPITMPAVDTIPSLVPRTPVRSQFSRRAVPASWGSWWSSDSAASCRLGRRVRSARGLCDSVCVLDIQLGKSGAS